MKLSRSDYESIRSWIYRNARPLDLARWQYHFEKGSKETVLTALGAYQNEDGGFGNALEPDFWNPNSSPVATGKAIELLEEIEWRDGKHASPGKILTYLETTPDFDGERWSAVVLSTKDHPHAPWWVDSAYDWGFTPTALLAGFVLFHAPRDKSLYKKAEQIARTAVDKYLFGTMPDGKAYNSVRREGEIQSLTQMLTFMEGTTLGFDGDLAEMKKVLNRQAQTFIEKDDAKWGQYCWKPSVFVKSPDSLFYPGNEKAIETELDYILNKRNSEGVWDIHWTWGAYEKEFAISQNWWKASLVIEHLRMLKSFGRS